MEKTPLGTSVGVDDPYAFVDRCDHLTDDGRCRYAAEYAEHDEAFARERRQDDLKCPVVDPDREVGSSLDRTSGEREPDSSDPRAGDWEWEDCPHFRSRQRDRQCVRCGLEERRMALSDERPLLEEHHLQYREGGPRADDGQELAHEITVYLCRWCHAKVHYSWARVDDDGAPDPEALAEAEERRSRELEETGFRSAAERFDADGESD